MEYKEILNKCLEKLKNDYVMDNDVIKETYYSIYLTSLGVRNGTLMLKYLNLEHYMIS